MKLTMDQLAKIKYRINLLDNKEIVLVYVSTDENVTPQESTSNIYCITQNSEIVWQVKEIKTQVPFEDDMFSYLRKNENGEIYAVRFSGFEYRIDTETGEAIQIGFRKA